MGTKALRKRAVWQDASGIRAEAAEKNFFDVFSKHFEGTEFRIRKKPREFKDVYSQVALHESVLAEIYNPADQVWVHGVIPDYAIDNTMKKKTLYVEVKRQDGWVEGKQRKDGRGNAHERLCKYFTPGLIKLLRKMGNLEEGTLPFWIVFQGDIARDPKRVREVTYWFDDFSAHFFMWSNNTVEESIVGHFERNLKKFLL